MKRYLLFIISMLCVSIGAWADDATINNPNWSNAAFNDRAIITSGGAGSIAEKITSWNTAYQYNWGGKNALVIKGEINQADINALASITLGNSIDYAVIDLSEATISGDINYTFAAQFAGVRLPVGADLTANYGNTISYVMSSGLTGPKNSANEEKGSNEIDLHIIKSGGIQKFINTWQATNNNGLWCVQYRTVNLTGDASVINKSSEEYTNLTSIPGVTVNYTVTTNDPYTVDGCNVSINTAKVTDGSTVADLLQLAKAKIIKEGTESNICTLTVAGPVTNQDLAALADAAMTGATRIDLSAATLASGASINNLRVPASLTQLVLPRDQTVSSTLATRLAAVTGLDYAYSPSSDCTATGPNQADKSNPTTYKYNDTKNTIADYVWVVKDGGLAQAFTNEKRLRNSFYIKVASSVALNATDVNFNALDTNKPTNYLFLDFSGSNLTPEMVANYRVTDQIGYRIILPDNWGVDDLATFAAMPSAHIGNLAAVYSYSGTTLKIMEITDGSYVTAALKNPRIVRRGTTAIEVVGKLEKVGTEWKQRGDLGDNLIAALNQADDDPDDDEVNNIKTININVGQANTILTTISFTNTNIEHFTMAGVKNFNNANTGPGVDVSECTKLQTIDVSNSTLQLLDAHGLTNLTSVDMSGTLMTNANGLSGETILTGCTSLTTSGFVTTNTTQFIKDLKLINTGLTSFATPAKVTGDIYLNASTSLTSVDLTQTDFQNETSKIHVDKAADESGAAALDALAKTETVGESQVAVKTIFVPNGFKSSARIHPYDAVKNNIGEAAGSSAGADGDECTITYDANTKIATVHTNTAGHFATMMASAYASYPQGTTFKFDATSKINIADLKALAGNINGTDYSWRSNYYYVDLFDLTASADLCNTPSTENPDAKGAIYNTIEWLRTNNRQFKGLILPKDHTLYGSGTTLIQDTERTASAVATCSEFIAYYKTKEIKEGASEPSDLTNQLLVAHVYNQSNSSSAYQGSYDKMKSLLDLHTEIANNADIYSISTNSINKINISDLPAATEIEIVNNEMVGTATTANVYVYPDVAGHFATAVKATGLKSTPTELMKIEGPINSDDITAINDFDTDKTADKVNGPRVLDLSAATDVTKALVASLTNKDIEYIILPAGMTKDDVCNNNYSALTSLKAVISTNGTDLVAYVNTPGSLAEARYYATGGSVTGDIFTPTQTGLQSVTLAGHLNASDIAANTTDHYLDENGHWTTTSGNLKSVALWGEQGTITTIDLKDAVFAPQTDMNFSYAGLASLHDIILPTSEVMTLIPADCFEGITSFDDLCIPYNYTKIDNRALHGTYCSHITTTDANGALVDNGARTYTFSANLQYIGSQPDEPDANGVYALTETVFPQNRGVTDVYVLAHKTPKCYANAFPANMLYGWGGFKGGNFPYCREKYDNSSDGSLIFTVLHFPDKASFNATDDDKKDADYDLMKKQYTDVNKVYSMKEQTGAVDANGDVITWPTFSELRRTYNQATNGMTWNDWVATYDSNHEVNGGDNIPTTSQPAGSGVGDYGFAGYEGWHQFTLAMATYVEPEKTVVDNIIINEYVKTDRWYTFCIPYSITADQLQEILGVPASTETVKSKVYKSDGTTVLENESTGHNPEARTLNGVQRQPATTPGGVNNVTLYFSLPMVQDNSTAYYYWNINDGAPYSSGQAVCGNTKKNKVIAMRGGLPYIVKPYLPKGVTVKNLGQYVMERFAARGKFTEDQACGNLGTDYYEQLGNRNKVTSRFVKPYEKHKIQAYKSEKDANKYYKHTDGSNYYYAFVGQFWEQDLPKYSLYVVNGQWYRYASGNKGYKLAPYKCVVMAVPQDDTDTKANSGKYRSAARSSIPKVDKELDDDDVFENVPFYLGFLDGLDDESFEEGSASARETNYIFALDGDIIEYDENGDMVTGIDSLDGEDLKPAVTDGKIYNMTGQFVGTSIEGLSSGMYIMNGKKFVVK